MFNLRMALLTTIFMTLTACGKGSTGNEEEIKPYHYQPPMQLADGWPIGSLYDTPFDVEQIEELISAIQNGSYPEIDAILVAQSGKLFLEEYFNGYSATKLHETQSMIKSFDSAVVGILHDRNYIQSLDQPIRDFLPELEDIDWSDLKTKITVGDLLTMRAGLDCHESKQDGCNATNINQSQNWARFTLSQTMAHPPGTEFYYFSGLNLVMHRIIENQTGESFTNFIDENLLAPMDIVNYRFDHSPSGEALGAHMLPRDMAKFGQLYLNQGQWNGQQLISSSWVLDSTSIKVEDGQWLEQYSYGYWWWLLDAEKSARPFNFIGARGARGQWIILMPERELLLVFTGNKETNAVLNIIEKYFYYPI